jgi:hypothetical protein
MTYRGILLPMTRVFIVSFAAAAIVLSNLPASADYTIVLKNGRQLIVRNFREEGGMVKFQGLGGEIAVSKQHIETIRPGDGERAPGFDLNRTQPISPVLRKENVKTDVNGKMNDEKEYQTLLTELEVQIKASKDQYSELTGGIAFPEAPNLTQSLQMWTTELSSTLKEGQNSSVSSYSKKELELKALREQIINLENEKSRLTQQMKELHITPHPKR